MALGQFTLKIDVREIGQSLEGPPAVGEVSVVPNGLIVDPTSGEGPIYLSDDPYLLGVDGRLSLVLPTGVDGLQYTVTVKTEGPRHVIGPKTFNAPESGVTIHFKDIVGGPLNPEDLSILVVSTGQYARISPSNPNVLLVTLSS